MTKTQILDQAKDTIVKKYNSGASCASLAAEYGCNTKWLWKWLKKNGVNLRKIGEHKRKTCSTKHGYRLVPSPDDYPKRFGNNSRLYYEHVLLYEKHIGRILDNTSEFLHHVNLDKLDNRIENLELCSKQSHSEMHNQLNKVVSQLIKANVIIFDPKTKTYLCPTLEKN